jgi:hypothetical protein
MIGLAALSGCAGRQGDGDKPVWEYIPPPVVALSQGEREEFCKSVAAPSDDDVFDPPTRARMFETNYRQCLTFYTGKPDR